MPYCVPQHIDPSKIFLVNFSELEGRWDSFFTLYNKRVKNVFEFPLVQLKDVLIKSPQYGTAECGIERKAETEPRYIRITDIDELGNLIDGLGATAEKLEEQYILNEGDILFARSGATVGKTYLHKTLPYQCFFAGYMIRIVVDKAKILPEYLFVYTQLQPYKDWVKAIQRAAAQPNINAEEYKSLPVPLPTIPIQQQIVNVYNAALSQRKKKLSESKAKLASIDKYLLGELGITLPEDSHEKTFIVNYKDVDGGRLDPFYQQSKYINIEKQISKGTYSPTKLKKLCYAISGVVYSSSDERKEGKAILRANNITLETNELNFDSIRYIDSSIKLSDDLRLHKNDILMCTASGSKEHAGKVAFISEELNYYFGGFMSVIRICNSGINATYLFEYMASRFFKLNLFRILGGTNINNVNFKMIENFEIPLPTLNKQREIADHISAIRAEAKRLEQEGEEILQSARQQVEKMILGKTA